MKRRNQIFPTKKHQNHTIINKNKNQNKIIFVMEDNLFPVVVYLPFCCHLGAFGNDKNGNTRADLNKLK